MKKVLLTALLLFGLTTITIAAQIAAEPFVGTAGEAVDGTTGGIGWAGEWTVAEGGAGSFTFVDPGMTFTGLDSTSGQKAIFDPTGATTARFNRALTAAVTVDATNTQAWACALMEVGSGSGDVNLGRGFGVELTNAGTPIVGFGKKLNSSYGVGPAATGAGWVNSSVPANVVGITFVVLKLEFDGTDTVATVYAATEGATIDIADPTSFTGTATITIAGAVTFDGVNLYGYHGGTTSNGIDEIHVADSYDTLFASDTARSPEPANGETNVAIDKVLSWTGPDVYEAEKYDVYFGTDPNAIENRTAGTKVLTGTTATQYTPTLALDTQYFWAVDSYEAGNATPYAGKRWSFTVMPPVVLIDTDPVSQTVAPDATVTLTTIVLNAETYQWFQNSSAITEGNVTGITTDTLVITGATVANEGSYTCVASNSVPSEETTAPALLMTKRLVGHWTFDNTLADEITGIDAVIFDPNTENAIEPTVTLDVDAQVGTGCLTLDNTADIAEGGWLIIPGSEEVYNFYPQGITISTWTKTPVDQSGEYNNIVEKNVGVTASRIFQRVAGTDGLFRMGGGGAWTNTSISDGQWHMMVTTYDPETGIAQVYLNGEPKGSATMTPIADGNTAPLVIGGSSSETGMGWIGSIDDVKIYSYPLTNIEVAYAYTDDAPGTTVCTDAVTGLTYDFNGDCIVDLEDFATFAATWMNCNIVPDCIDRP